MTCCICNGSCCHVGPHIYCAAHQVQPVFVAPPPVCSHCYCQPDAHINGVPHQRCCKCSDRHAVTIPSISWGPSVTLSGTSSDYPHWSMVPSLPFIELRKGA